MNDCRRLLPALDAFVDGELPPDKMLELEQHLVDCRVCRERVAFQQAVQISTREVVQRSAVASEAFRARVEAALAAEHDREDDRASLRELRGGSLTWRSIVPMAAAAALVLVWAASVNQSQPSRSPGPQTAHVTPIGAKVEQLLDEFVEHHANPPQPEVVDESLIPGLEPEVGVPVRVPTLSEYGAEWEGGSVVLISTQRRRAASLRYNLDGHRLTVYVYDAARFPLRATLEPRVVRNIPVYVGTRRGYSIAAAEKRGVGYAVATDLDDSESAELVAISFH